jgi:hypothetical protein
MTYTPKVGDLVRKPKGVKPIKVTNVHHNAAIYGEYIHSYEQVYLFSNQYVPYDSDQQPNQKENIMQLYEIKHGEATTFGTKLAVNSEKKWVMEEKGTGAVFVVDPANVKKVMPYTVDIRFRGDGQAYSYLADKGAFKKDEFYLVKDVTESFLIVQVVAVDTESEKATKEFKPLGRLNVELM